MTPDTEVCQICQGAGFLHPRSEKGIDYRKVVPCQCLKRQIEGAYPGADFAEPPPTFDNFKVVDGVHDAYRFAKELAQGTAPFIWLLIYGGTGNGKTHLLKAIYRTTLQRGINSYYYISPNLFSLLRKSIDDKTIEDKLEKLKEVPMLIIDEFGLEYGSDWEMAKFEEVLTCRFANFKPTVMATNRDFSELPERIKSRFSDKILARAVLNRAPDYRLRKKKDGIK